MVASTFVSRLCSGSFISFGHVVDGLIAWTLNIGNEPITSVHERQATLLQL